MSDLGTPQILNASGRPARPRIEDKCPRCGRGPEVRVPSSGFGVAHPVCSCGYEWMDAVWQK